MITWNNTSNSPSREPVVQKRFVCHRCCPTTAHYYNSLRLNVIVRRLRFYCRSRTVQLRLSRPASRPLIKHRHWPHLVFSKSHCQSNNFLLLSSVSITNLYTAWRFVEFHYYYAICSLKQVQSICRSFIHLISHFKYSWDFFIYFDIHCSKHLEINII